jgi:hypothetical protein
MATKKQAPAGGVPAEFQSANFQAEFWKPETEGEQIRGYYQGARILPARPGYKEQDCWDVALDGTGEMQILTGAALKRQFERVPEGAEVIVIYHGRKQMKGGKAPMKDFTVHCKGELLPIKKND